MKISESTIAEIVKRGDSTTLYEIIRRFAAGLGQRTAELQELRQNYERLKKLFAVTELDKDRFHMIAKELVRLCAQNGLSQQAAEIANEHGGLDTQTGEISIDLE